MYNFASSESLIASRMEETLHLGKQNAGVYSTFVSFHHSTTLGVHMHFPYQQPLFFFLERKLLLVFIVVLTRLIPFGKTIVPDGRFAIPDERTFHTFL